MDKREMLKRYVELMVNVVKVEQPYMDLLGTDWYERENGLGSAYEKIFDFVEELKVRETMASRICLCSY